MRSGRLRYGAVRITLAGRKPANITSVYMDVTPTRRRISAPTDLEHCPMSSPTRPAPSDVITRTPRQSSGEAPVLVVAARPDARGLAAAEALADRVGGAATTSRDADLETRLRGAAKVIVLDPSQMRARLTRDRAFSAPADPAARRDLLSRLAPHQDRVRWVTRPGQEAQAA
jgi:hypothetical protein